LKRSSLSSVQLAMLGLLAAAGCAVAVMLALFVVADALEPPLPEAVALAALPTLTLSPSAGPPTAVASPSPPPSQTALPSPTATRVVPAATATASPSATLPPSITPTETASPSATPLPTATPTPLWATAPPATWLPATALPAGSQPPPSLADFWEGRAVWQLEHFDVGLPLGESDTLVGPDGQLWSYLHASSDSRGIVDQWGQPVPFPGCVTLWRSSDRGQRFHLFAPRCLLACRGNPCGAIADDIDQQQYPRVARAAGGLWVMVYEWRAQVYLRTSLDGLNWTRSRRVPGTGVWNAGTTSLAYGPCQDHYRIGPHPFVPEIEEYDCLSGAPPGLFIEGEELFVFVGMGKNPGHLGCYRGPLAEGAAGLAPCAANPLFTGAGSYGPPEAAGPEGNPYFDFRTVSSADVIRAGDRYYLTYEGVRGPGPGASGDTQFNLGLARSLGPALDGAWEKYPGNPILGDVPGNVGLGHADLLVLDGVTYLYTATSGSTRGRYVLAWR
jgi:hypothetical protein